MTVASGKAAVEVTDAWQVPSALGWAHLSRSRDEFLGRTAIVDRMTTMASGRVALGVTDVRDSHVMAYVGAVLGVALCD